jgi:hypothetical protein
MNRPVTTSLTASLLTIVAVTTLAACSAPTTPDSAADPTSASAGGGADAPCAVGLWQLDVADYAAQMDAYLLGIGIPITEFVATGEGTVEFTPDGLASTDIDLTSTGTLVSGDVSVPLTVRSVYTGTGDWSDPGDGLTIDLTNWVTEVDPTVVIDPGAPEFPLIDFTGIPSVSVTCTDTRLTLRGPDAPVTATFTR